MKRLQKDALLLTVCLAQFMVILDISIVNVALPDIHSSLGFSDTGLPGGGGGPPPPPPPPPPVSSVCAPARHPRLARLILPRPAGGAQHLHAHLRRLPDAGRPRHRPPPPPPGLPGRGRALLRRFARLCARRRPEHPDRRPRDPGLRRRGDLG